MSGLGLRRVGASLRGWEKQMLAYSPSVIAVLATALLCSSCAVGPDFVHPATPEVTRYTKEHFETRTSSTDVKFGQSQRFVNGRDIPAEWWRMFRSPALNSLVEKSLVANPNLQSTIAALRASKENVYAQQGKYFPVVQANFNPTRQQTPGPIAPVLNSSANPFNLYTAQLTVSYTFDIWGQNRRAVEALQATADSQRFQIEAAYLALTSNIVVAAVQEASLRGQIEATNRIIDANSKMLDILRKQFTEGYANRSDVAAQEAALAQVRATLPPLRKALAQQRDLLAALAGRYPSQEPKETFRLADLRLPTDLPVSVPGQLVEQRPDVRLAEELLHTASAQVGVAIANMLPSLTITGSRGYSASDIASLFSGPSIFWTVAGNATQPVFDGFNLLHTERATVALYEAAAWNYRTTVIGAFQNVADSLRAIQNDSDAVKASSDFEKAAKISLDLAQQQMQTGNANVLLLLNAQVTYEQAVIQLVQAQAARVSDTAALYQALGGGWWNRIEPPAPEQKLDVATGQFIPVPEDTNWLSTVLGGARWWTSEAPAPEQHTEVAKAQSGPQSGSQTAAAAKPGLQTAAKSAPPSTPPPADEGTWSMARLLRPFGVADNQAQGAAGEGTKP
jgi:NodT family efflux transporter outer membrane factor (OMF) lipoprotein